MENNLSLIHNLIKMTNKNIITSKEMDIFETFESENIFIIKEFQRKYEWAKLQIQELINEISQNDNSNTYFLGMIILKKENISNEKTSLSIIDGQQRITTLFLILKCLEINIQKFRLHDPKMITNVRDILTKIKSAYITNKNGTNRLKISQLRGEEELKNILIDNNFEDEEYINSDSLKNPIYTQAFKNINDMLKSKSLEELINFYEKVELIKFSIVILGSKMNEYKVFEDLNSKGVDLKIDDLIRNYFAQKATIFGVTNVQENIDQYEQLLNQIEVFLKIEKKNYRGYFSKQIGRWFKNYILHKLDAKKKLSDTNDKRMYVLYKEEIHNKITKLTDLLEEIELIKKYLKFCMWMSEEKDNELYLVNDIEMYPIFFELYKNAENNNYDLEILKKIFALLYIVTICSNKNLKDFNKSYLEKIKTIFYKNDDFKIAITEILETMNYTTHNMNEIVEKKILEDSVIWNEQKMKRFIMYFFSKMIEDQTNKEIKLYDENFNIEHIISQNPDWNKISDMKESKQMINLWFINVNRLKNLALIESSLNEQLGNKSYQDKKKIFDNIKNQYEFLESTKEIFEKPEFGENELNSRFNKMKEFSKDFLDKLIKKID